MWSNLKVKNMDENRHSEVGEVDLLVSVCVDLLLVFFRYCVLT